MFHLMEFYTLPESNPTSGALLLFIKCQMKFCPFAGAFVLLKPNGKYSKPFFLKCIIDTEVV